MMGVVEIPPRPLYPRMGALEKGGEHPLTCAERSLPFVKGGQEGFSDACHATTVEIPPNPPLGKGGEHPSPHAEGSLPYVKPPCGDKGGQEGFNPARSTPCA